MSLPVVEMPDVEHLLMEHLRSLPEIQALAAQRVGLDLPTEDAVFPRLVIQLLPGFLRVRDHLWVIPLTLQAYGNSRDDAWNLIKTADAQMRAMSGGYPDGVVTAVFTRESPWWLPDDSVASKPRPRYVADYEMTVHPHR
jgi:hypothetical protein